MCVQYHQNRPELANSTVTNTRKSSRKHEISRTFFVVRILLVYAVYVAIFLKNAIRSHQIDSIQRLIFANITAFVCISHTPTPTNVSTKNAFWSQNSGHIRTICHNVCVIHVHLDPLYMYLTWILHTAPSATQLTAIHLSCRGNLWRSC